MKSSRKAILTACAISAFASFPVLAGRETGNTSANVHDSKVFTLQDEVHQILRNVEQQSCDLKDSADLLHSGATSGAVDRDFYLDKLTVMKDDINAMGKEIAYIEAVSSGKSSPERNIADRARPVLGRIAKSETDIISFLNDSPDDVVFSPYRDMIASLWDQTGVLQKMLHDSVQIRDIRARERRLRGDFGKIQSTTD